jgi:glutamate racemase
VNETAPIGIFDSGLGGLTVCAAIESSLPGENLIYLGDTARVPYGVKSPDTVTRYSEEICDFLIAKGVKAIVVACNTASALALPRLKGRYSIPLLGVLEPGVEAALKSHRGGKVGIIGTEATIRSESYPRALSKADPKIQVLSQACPLFVPLVEEGWIDHPVTREVAEIYLGPWREAQLDAIILACTHYPLLKGVLSQSLQPQVVWVDSALETARVLGEVLKNNNLLNQETKQGSRQYFTTDAPQKMQGLAQAFLGHALGEVRVVQLN